MSKVEIIKGNLKGLVGKPVMIKSDLGRNKTLETEGVVTNTYPGVFTVEVNYNLDVTGTVSFSYSDVLCDRVVITPLVS